MFDQASVSEQSSEDDDHTRTATTSKSRKKQLKSGKLLKATSHVKRQEAWPHVFLSRAQPGVTEKKYDELTIPEFVSGFVSILALRKISNEEKQARLLHLGDLMNLATVYQWEAVLEFHGACLLALERDTIRWGESFARLENISIAGRFLLRPAKSSASRGKPQAGGPSIDGPIYCAAYNRGLCSHAKTHEGAYRNRSVTLLHVCSDCLRVNNQQAQHVSGANNCPLVTDSSAS